jgi:hypothetical protein
VVFVGAEGAQVTMGNHISEKEDGEEEKESRAWSRYLSAPKNLLQRTCSKDLLQHQSDLWSKASLGFCFFDFELFERQLRI